jgi:hypothetical protein
MPEINLQPLRVNGISPRNRFGVVDQTILVKPFAGHVPCPPDTRLLGQFNNLRKAGVFGW